MNVKVNGGSKAESEIRNAEKSLSELSASAVRNVSREGAKKDPEAIKACIRENKDVSITLYRDHRFGRTGVTSREERAAKAAAGKGFISRFMS